jgi:GH24 family phage-related lysozyme (muramidase)
MKAFDGTLFTRTECEKFINSIPTSQLEWVQRIVIHNTGAPNMHQEDKTPDVNKDGTGEDDRMRNTKPHYAKWDYNGPHFFVFNSGSIGLGDMLPSKGVHSPSWNSIAIGVEMVADFRPGVDNPYTQPGLTIVDTAAWLFAVILRKLGLPCNNDTVKLHKEDKKTTHDCPGDLFLKADFLKRINEYLGKVVGEDVKVAPITLPNAPGVPGLPVKETVYNPGTFKFSEYLVTMMKRVEGWRDKAYYDKPGWAIGYGHNSTSKLAPIPYDGMVITKEEGDRILREVDLKECLRYVNAWIKVPLTEGNVDALCMYIFQQGPGNFKKKLLPTINEKKHWTTAKLIENQGHANAGVMRRRKLEAEIYRGNKPTKW